MNETLEKAKQALLEGDRDGVVHLLRGEPDTPEVIWLRANAAESDDERGRWYAQLANGDSIYAELARAFLDRDRTFEKELNEPPDYQFWKQPTWKKRLQKMQAYRLWVYGGVLLLFFGIFATILNGRYQSQFQQQALTVQTTQTAQAFVAGAPIAEYPEGSISISSVEDPTARPVTYGEKQNDAYIVAQPPKGARFVAVQINFQCSLAICSNPPEALLSLLLADATTIGYDATSRPFLIEQPLESLPRVVKGQYIQIWYVFEVSRLTSPTGMQVISTSSQTPQVVTWPVH